MNGVVNIKNGVNKMQNEEVLRKIIGFMQVLASEGIPHIKIAFEDDRHILIQDYSRRIITQQKMTFDQFVSTDTKLLIQATRSMQNGERNE